jgi:hypothetical protein
MTVSLPFVLNQDMPRETMILRVDEPFDASKDEVLEIGLHRHDHQGIDSGVTPRASDLGSEGQMAV